MVDTHTLIRWIGASRDPRAPKHWKSWSHPLLTMGAVWVSAAGIAIVVGDRMEAPVSDDKIVRPAVWRRRGMYLGTYLTALVLARARDNGPIALYEFPWACNVSMLLAVLGLVLPKQRPNLVGAAMASCCADQVFWYVDFLGYAVLRKFVVGVAGYMVWPQTSMVTRLTSLHHIWFIPLCAAYISEQSERPAAQLEDLVEAGEAIEVGARAGGEARSSSDGGRGGVLARRPARGAFNAKVSYALSMVGVLVCSILSRVLTPYSVWSEKLGAVKYMNINLSYEMWRDVKIGFLHVLDGASAFVFTPALLLFYNVVNGPIYVALLMGLKALRRRAAAKALATRRQLFSK
jgi:hypothetical protein